MKIVDYFKSLFKKKNKEEEKGLIIQKGLPPIDERTPLVSVFTNTEIKVESEEEKVLIAQYMKSCSVCKFALHHEGLEDLDEVLCTVDPNRPTTKKLQDTCLKHQPKYKNIKVLVDKPHLMEYDSGKAIVSRQDQIPDRAIIEIGEDQWQQ